MKMEVTYLENHAGTPLAYGSEGAAGLDIAAGAIHCHWRIPGHGSRLIPTGLAVAIPDGHFGRIVMRSGHGIKRDLSCHVGTIDSDYRGEIMVLVRNHGAGDQTIEPGERFAQLIVMPCPRIEVTAIDELPLTKRGAGGFGSTGS